MPVCFQLFPKGSAAAATLQHVDNLMREYFDEPPDDEHWYKNWYDTIGLMLAIGKNFTEIKGIFPEKQAIVDWLEVNYTTEAWWEPKS